MSRFYASIEGQAKTQATRQGSTKSGIRGHIRGWNLGIEINGFTDKEDNDVFEVCISSGSNHHNSSIYAFSVKKDSVGELEIFDINNSVL